MTDKFKLLIAIPTFCGAKRVDLLVKHLKSNNFINNSIIKIIIIENPSKNNIRKNAFTKFKNIEYLRNNQQIGLDGSWLKILEIYHNQTDWLMFLGDDDIINFNSKTLLDLVSKAEEKSAEIILSIENSNSYKKFIKLKKKLFDNTLIEYSFINYKKYIGFSKLSDNFSYISSSIFKPNKNLFKAASENKSRMSNTDCLHYLTLFPYAYRSNKKVMILNYPNMISAVLRKNRMNFSTEEIEYLKTFKFNKKYFNLFVWIKCEKDLMQINEKKQDLKQLLELHKELVFASFVSWIFNSRSKGIIFIIKLVINYFKGVKEAKAILGFMLYRSRIKILKNLK